MTATITSVTDPQVAQVKMLVEHAIRKSGVDFDGLQLLIERGGEFQNGLAPLITRLSRKEENSYADEQKEQVYYYPKGWKPSILSVQADRLATLLPGIDLSHLNMLAGRFSTLPEGADGLFIWPTHTFLGRHWGVANPYDNSGPITANLFELLRTDRGGKGTNYLTCDNKHHRFDTETFAILREIEANIPGDALVLPASLGNYYAGYSPRNAHWEATHSAQLPGPDTHGIIALLTSPDRLTEHEHLFMDCPGTQYRWRAEGWWTDRPYLFFGGGCVGLFARRSGRAYGSSGSLVSFLG